MILSFIQAYAGLNVLIVIGFLFLSTVALGLNFFKISIRYSDALKLQYLTFSCVIFFTILSPFVPSSNLFEPVAKIDSGSTLLNFNFTKKTTSPASQYSTLNSPKEFFDVSSDHYILSLIAAALCIFVFSVLKLFADLKKIQKIKNHSHLVRKIGRVSIYSNESVGVPFSFLSFSAANVFIPSKIIYNSNFFRISVAHEIQHHRQKDTIWAYIIWSLKLICPFNPFLYVWSKWLSETQEYACDETLVDQKKVEPQAYASCLVEVAQNCLNQKMKPVSATGISYLIGTQFLKRRILQMNKKTSRTKKSILLTIGASLVSLFGFTTYASKGAIQDRKLTFEQVQAMVQKGSANSAFPIVINEQVVEQVNRFVGTQAGRDFMKASLKRMESYKELVSKKANEYKVPQEILALPIVESGYQNLPEKNKQGWGAGLWMFIKSTAKTYGMKVDEKEDQRLNVEQQTDAAMRYLSSNYLRFKDWHLSVLAYNIGESNVQKGIEKTGSKDAWVLIHNKFENDRNYLPKVMAAVLIMNNPKILE